MSKINRRTATSILVVMIMAASLISVFGAAGDAYASGRSMWVWSMAKDIILDTTVTGAQKDFFDFCAAPKGNSAHAITHVFFCAPHDYNSGTGLWTIYDTSELRTFLANAHLRGMKVDFLSGDKSWATPQYIAVGESLIDYVTTFNTGGAANQRFDGIQYDVEPYLLNTEKNGDPLDWNNDQALAWSTYLTLLSACQGKVNAYNTAHSESMKFSAAIPNFYTLTSTPSFANIIDRVDNVALMDYTDTSFGIISRGQDEIDYADTAGKKVYIGVETSHPTDLIDAPPSATFYEEGNAAMETALGAADSAFAANASYAGIAIHYYEDLAGSKGKEFSYRSLWTSSYPGHYPIVHVVSPRSPADIFAGITTIQWEASDLDSHPLTIDLQYSADGGSSWTAIATGLANSGSYTWDTTALTAGSNYLIKAITTDTSAGLVNFTVSNTFSVSPTSSIIKTNITDLHLWNDGGSAIRLIWTPPNYTPRYYKINRSVNGDVFSLYLDNVIATNNYLDTGVVYPNKYKYEVVAVYGDGNAGAASNDSNMLIPSGNLLIDYCDNNEGITYGGPFGTSTLVKTYDTATKEEGVSSAKFVYTYVTGLIPASWGAVMVGTFPAVVDMSPYTAVTVWINGGTTGLQGPAIQLVESGGVSGDETYQSPFITISGPGWKSYAIPFSSFTKVSDLGVGNGRLDTHTIGGYALLFGAATANGTYYVDAIDAVSSASYITGPNSCDFGLLSGTGAVHRFMAGPLSMGFGGFPTPWTVRMWTNNNPAALPGDAHKYAGLKGADGVNYLPLKVWCMNFGPGTTVPNPNNDAYWVNNGSTYGWYRVPEYNEMDPGNPFTWRRLCWSPGAELPSPVDVYLAVDVTDALVFETYTTNTLTVEYINQ